MGAAATRALNLRIVGCGAVCRWEVNYDKLTLLNHHCCLCGLLCPVAMCWPGRNERHLPQCERLRNWLSEQDARGGSTPAQGPTSALDERLAIHAQRLRRARNPLLWIESADVSATRAAVRLAELCEATVHVAESPGAHNVAMVTANSGIFGTSLAEVWQHADVLVHIGRDHLREMPLLASRFLSDGGIGQSPSGRRHVFIDDNPSNIPQHLQVDSSDGHSGEVLQLHWPPAQWLERFTRLLLALRGKVACDHSSAQLIEQDTGTTQLAELLLSSRYAVVLWSEDLFADEADRMLVERLLEIAGKVSETTRCSLLPLAIDPGRTTAKEALLWLTNHSGTACCIDGRWTKPHLGDNVDLVDWHREHDWILALRTLPSDRLLPDLKFDLIIDAACNNPLHAKGGHSNHDAADIIEVAAVGLDCSGHVTRVDHAFGAHVAALTDSQTRPPTASNVIAELGLAYQAAGGNR